MRSNFVLKLNVKLPSAAFNLQRSRYLRIGPKALIHMNAAAKSEAKSGLFEEPLFVDGY